MSGACSQCGRLLQRWFVRTSKGFIADYLEPQKGELIAISIVPSGSTISPGQLQSVSIENFQRRMKYALDKANIEVGIGGLDFSFNEDQKGKVPTVLEPTPLRDHDNQEQKNC